MLQADRARFELWFAAEGGASRFHPAYLCVFLYRVSHYLWRRGNRHLARVVWQLNGYLTGSDIPPRVQIGPGLLIPCPCGVAIAAKVGSNFTLMSGAGVGSEIGRYEDIGAGPGLPVVGDDVVLEPRSGILGPVRIDSRVQIRAGAIATHDLEEDAVAEGPKARFLRAGEWK